MKEFLVKYLSKRGYHVWKAVPKPKVGQEIEFIVGGNWEHNTSYIQTGIVEKYKDNDPKRPFKEYDYIRAVIRKDGCIIADHTVYPKEIIKVTNPQPLEKEQDE